MKFLRFALAIAMLFIVSTSAAIAADGRYVIIFNGKNTPKSLAADINAAGGTLIRTIPQVGIAIANSSDENFAEAAAAIRGVINAGPVGAWTLPHNVAEVAIPEGPTATDDLFNLGLVWGVDRVHAPDAWSNGNTGSHETVVAIIDTGVAWNHPDLAANVVDKQCFTSTMPCNPYPAYSDHGTHVAGTVAGAFDGGRIVGVAPDTGIASYNTFEVIEGCGVCSYSDSRWLAMIDAAEAGYKVISMSLGGYVGTGGRGSNEIAAYLQAEKKVANYVKKQGTLMVASSGNGALNLNGGLVHVPGDIPQMINVSATGIQPEAYYPAPGTYDILAFYSNYGAAVDIAGPGGDCGQIGECTPATRPANWFEYLVLSSIVTPDPTCAETYSCPVGYGWKAGTSMATPHVSGVASLVYDANPGIEPDEVKEILKSTAEKIGSRQAFGAGMVRADYATD